MGGEALKLKLIHKILSYNDVNQLKVLDDVISKTEIGKSQLNGLVKPTREKLDIEIIKQEQNFQSINADEFFKELENLNIEEPLEDLLKMI